MRQLNLKDTVLSVDFQKGHIVSLFIKGKERIASLVPLFSLCLRNRAGETEICNAYGAKACVETEDGAIYKDFENADLSVRVYLTEENGDAAWRISVMPNDKDSFVEWVEFPKIALPALVDNNTNGDGGKILYPYNEGALVSDLALREASKFMHRDAEYPSRGSFSVFPNMICSQMLAYLWEDAGLYVGAHDKKRGVKEIDFLKEGEGVAFRFRLFTGCGFGESFATDYPILFSVTTGSWESAADRYRTWFESALPARAKKISENRDLPGWYADAPLIVSYPVRGIHDMDEMQPNKLYPYANALQTLDAIREASHSRLLVLLMHWEGTAPWAPPYVWPPFGGVAALDAFKDALHKRGDLLGVYCSGFGYTIQSNLIAEYNKEAEYQEQELWQAMCAGADGKVAISNICAGQRVGYDICPASAVGKALLKKAYAPLFENGLDYIQVLDQNHGGGQYFCYSREHGHAPGPGAWMTENMQSMLGEWNTMAGKTLLGCESAAAEPFVGNLLFSDNRFELNYHYAVPVPLYAYVYHQYLRNFMGNQVACPFLPSEDTLRYRLAYSFSIGDCMTLVLTQDGDLMAHWGMRDFSVLPDKEKALRLIGNLSRLYKEKAKPYLYSGKMVATPAVECGSVSFSLSVSDHKIKLPAILSSAWEDEDGNRALLLVNPQDKEAFCTVNGNEYKIPPLDALLLEEK